MNELVDVSKKNDIVVTEPLELDRKISSADVTDLIRFRTSIWREEDPRVLRAMAEAYGIEITGDTRNVKKRIFKSYFEGKFPPQSSTVEEHAERLADLKNDLVRHLTLENSQAIVWVFGSFAKGKINGTHSDLDYIIALPQIDNPLDRQAEIEKLARLYKSGYVFSKELGPFNDLIPIMQNGSGLARLYALTQSGVEAEFHVLGEKDVLAINKLWPGMVKRVREIDSKKELRISFTGTRENLPKPGDRVVHYQRHNGEVFKGFFVDNLACAQLVYDPRGIGERVQTQIWQALVKGFIYHNKALEKQPDGTYIIDPKKLAFDRFIKTFYYAEAVDYNPDKLAELENDYWMALSKLVNRKEMRMRFTPF